MNRREALIQMAVQRGCSEDVAKAALNDTQRDAIKTLLVQIQKAEDRQYIIMKYVGEILQSSVNNGNFLDIADLLISIPTGWIYGIIQQLGQYGDNAKAIALLREITNLEWATDKHHMGGANVLFYCLYNKGVEALDDDSSLVRIYAAKYFEREQNSEVLIKTLTNSETKVRTIAAWYMGRRKVKTAKEALTALLETEEDVETLRAVIWSLGILEAKEAQDKIVNLSNHYDERIRIAVQQALPHLQ